MNPDTAVALGIAMYWSLAEILYVVVRTFRTSSNVDLCASLARRSASDLV